MPHLVGVFREAEYSPGRVADDAAILEETAAALRARGMTVDVGNVDLLEATRPDAVLAMCQSPRALAALERHAAHIPVMNGPDAIRACHRGETTRRLLAAGAPFPRTRMVATGPSDPATFAADAPCWVKRGDVHAMASDDVVFAPDARTVAVALAAFGARGIPTAALQAHVEGPVVKFYGLADGRFFRCYTDRGEPPAPLPVLFDVARAGATALGLDVFGGDLVVTATGRAILVDVNDWPSFSRCRAEAAPAIAGYVADRLSPHRACPERPHAPVLG